MTGEPGSNDAPPTLPDEEIRQLLDDPQALAWFDEHVSDVRDTTGQRVLLYTVLVIGFLVGLSAHVAGYLLRLDDDGTIRPTGRPPMRSAGRSGPASSSSSSCRSSRKPSVANSCERSPRTRPCGATRPERKRRIRPDGS